MNKYTYHAKHKDGTIEVVPIYVYAKTEDEASVIAQKMIKKKSQSWFKHPKSQYYASLFSIEKKA